MANPKRTYKAFEHGYDLATKALLRRSRASEHNFTILHEGDYLGKGIETPNLRPELNEFGLPTMKYGKYQPATAARYDMNVFPEELRQDSPTPRNTPGSTPKPRPGFGF